MSYSASTPSAAHAAHFLERLDRIPRSQVDFALMLYRDAELLKWILLYAKIDEKDARVALALEDGGEGPHVIVTRDAHFVTTLGKGMSTGPHPVVSRAQIDVFVQRVEEARRRREISRELVPSGMASYDILGLTGKRPDALSREEVSAILGWRPLLQAEFLVEAFKVGQSLEDIERSIVTITGRPSKTKMAEIIDEAHRFAYTLGVLFTLAAAGEMPWIGFLADTYETYLYGVTFTATSQRLFATAMRGAWMAARIGKALLPSYKRILLSNDSASIARYDALLAVTAIGLRHARLSGDATRIVETARAVGDDDPWVHQFAPRALRALSEPDAAIEDALIYGRKRYAALSLLLPGSSPHRFTNEHDVPRELGLLALVNCDVDCVSSAAFDMLPWVARVGSPEELHFPEPLPRMFLPVVRRHQQAVARIDRLRTDWGAAKTPAKREAAPGRNEACSCGSGKKFKKCCGR